MEHLAAQIPDDLASLKALLLKKLGDEQKLRAALEDQRQRVKELEAILKIFQRRTFGANSEQTKGMTPLFDEAEATTVTAPEEKQSIKYDRNRPRRRPLPDALPRIEKTYELPDDQRSCQECQETLKPMGFEVTEQLDVIPMKVQVIAHKRVKYACPCCKGKIVTAPMPKVPIPRSNASAGTLAWIATSKYLDHLPLYRQEDMFRRAGIDQPRSTLARWMIEVGRLIQPLINLMQEDLLASPVLHMDETHVQVLKSTGKNPTSKSWMWVRCRAGPRPIIMFSYDPTRGAAVARELLAGYSGALMVDGYEAYEAAILGRAITRYGCWDHARRKFFEAVESLTNGDEPSWAKTGLWYCNRLYDVEREFKGSDLERIARARHLYSRGIVSHMRSWLDRALLSVTPKSPSGKAISYLHGQWDRLIGFLDNPAVPLSNAIAENAIRPFALGRKNWLFSDTRSGAESSANIYSLITTAKANGLDPHAYLQRTLNALPNATTVEEIAALLPYSI